ncbi:MAG TPA: hypothetical protein VHP38_00010 [Ruminiclostridium sp.]|nr:hypothetical protein [Ruminiclostridium sp.]
MFRRSILPLPERLAAIFGWMSDPDVYIRELRLSETQRGQGPGGVWQQDLLYIAHPWLRRGFPVTMSYLVVPVAGKLFV